MGGPKRDECLHNKVEAVCVTAVVDRSGRVSHVLGWRADTRSESNQVYSAMAKYSDGLQARPG